MPPWIPDSGHRKRRRRHEAGVGITRGAEVQVVRRAPMGDPIEVVVKNYHLALREKEAALIEVEPVVS